MTRKNAIYLGICSIADTIEDLMGYRGTDDEVNRRIDKLVRARIVLEKLHKEVK